MACTLCFKKTLLSQFLAFDLFASDKNALYLQHWYLQRDYAIYRLYRCFSGACRNKIFTCRPFFDNVSTAVASACEQLQKKIRFLLSFKSDAFNFEN